MKIKKVFYSLLILTIIAAVALILTSREPVNKTAGDNPAQTSPTKGADSALPSPTNGADPNQHSPNPGSADEQIAEPSIETIPVHLSEITLEAKNINPDIPPVFNGENSFMEHAKTNTVNGVEFTYWHFLGSEIVTSDVENPGVFFGSPEKYTDVEGITTFRGNHFRDNAAYGSRLVSEKKLELVWTKDIGAIRYGNTYWPGVGWTGQPLIIHWDKDIRKLMNIDPSLKQTDLVEVIYPTLDGNIYFLNLKDGKSTRKPINIGYSTKGTATIDPRGYPILYTGQGLNQNGDNAAYHEYRIFSLIDQKQIFSIKGTTPEAFRLWGAFDPSGIIDRKTDTLIQPGENGLLYRIKLNTDFDIESGKLSINPEITKFRYMPVFDQNIGYENSPAVYRNYLYLADNGGMLQCIDINTLEPVWIANLEDDTDSTIVIEETDEGVFLYTGNEADIRCINGQTRSADCQLRKFNALTGELVWQKEYNCIYQAGVNGGLLSTPVVGKNDISNLVIFNIAKTDDAKSGKMVALDKKTGKEVWVKDLENYSWSSPVDFLSDDGKTYMIFCDFAGNMHLIDPKNGEILDTISVGLNVEASPAIYNDMIVVGTYAKKIYGVRIK
jgi:outer membrane protein assembly factor BamB